MEKLGISWSVHSLPFPISNGFTASSVLYLFGLSSLILYNLRGSGGLSWTFLDRANDCAV